MDRPFEILEHTADVGLRAYGATLPQLYENAASGLLSLLANPQKVEPREQEVINVEGTDGVDLMVSWLHEIVFRFDARHMAFARAEVIEVQPWRLTARLYGEPLDHARHEPGMEIKAVTWHGAKVEPQEGGWVAEVLFDI